MSLLWKTAVSQVEAAKPVPSKKENLDNTTGSYHEMTPEEFAEHPGTMWHGSPNGKAGLGKARYGLHVGTKLAAKQALEARIGKRADGKDWDGKQEYGKTLLNRDQELHTLDPETRTWNRIVHHHPPVMPRGKMPGYSDGTKMKPTDRPHLFPVRITGEMTNTPSTPHEDFKANGLMAGQVKKGTARRGYYYTNIGEDEGSISAVVPNADHLATHEDFVRHAHEAGKPIPDHNRERYGL